MAFSGLFCLQPIHSRALTIDHTQVPSTQTNFPVLFNFTDTTFKTLANGGHVANSNGYDIGFYSDSGGTTKLKWEIERYNASTGEVIAWIKIGSVSSVSDTVFYMFYGNTDIHTDQSDPRNVWTNNFLMVCHLKDGTTLSVSDSSPANTLNVNNGATAAAGQINGCGGFASASSQYILTDNSATINPAAITFSAWVNGTTFTNDYNSIINGYLGSEKWSSFVKSNGKMYMLVTGTVGVSYDGTGSHTLSTGIWYYITTTYDSSSGLIGYVNAASDGTAGANGNANSPSCVSNIGRQGVTNSRFWNGSIDEVRVSSIARSADWITCEYANQKSSSTFVSLGAEQ